MTLEHRPSRRVRAAADAQRLRELGSAAHLLELQGDLHFSSVEIIQRRIWKRLSTTKILLLDLSRVDSIDEPALESIERILSRLRDDGVEAAFSGVARDGVIRRKLLSRDDRKLMFSDLESALEAAEESLLRGSGLNRPSGNHHDGAIRFDDLELSQVLDAAERRDLEALLIRRSYEPGACICRKGEPAGEIYFLTRGSVSVRLYSDPQTFQRLAAFSPGSVFGEIAAIDRGPRSADVWAESIVECLILPLDRFDRLETERPALKIKLLQYLLRILTGRLRRANDLIGHLSG
jgi:CRP-like cAMP-binding protein/anti-anti-sigma regulatory factor